MPYSPLAIANFFIDKAGSEGGVEHLKLQKLVYCAHGWWLVAKPDAEPLTDEEPEAWKHGPVFPSLFRTLKIYGRAAIDKVKAPAPLRAPPCIKDDDTDAREVLEWVWERYKRLSAWAMSDLAHKEGTPWHTIAKEHNFDIPKNTKIPGSMVRDEFRLTAWQR